ncbi:endo-1,4-beta-xylanase [Amphibacillus xylanus]|uniref:Beta-xylanase n=1 Tax=Amphibacillus xylanus (strain ATCC 51415 / DSM 6626 / JCM 7361 / LMG 17667 / NBRC 15112 / Ep01) TaxID=698758 RepID=K0IZE4_AMPXN|nr:endo-1,4-beta-xylanase [Amphibacillus xylanus]BAM47864.1 endo-1,4-beta-xylanase [Amphibacillus xylanus NBRC 15112]
MVRMIKKYERTIAILLIAFLAVPLNLFTSLATVMASDGEEAEYTTVYETDFSKDDHKIGTQAGGSGSVKEVTIDDKTYDAFFMEHRPDGNWNSPTLSYADAGIEFGKIYRVTAEFYTNSDEFGGGNYQLTTSDHENPDINENKKIVPNEIVEMRYEGVIEIETNNHIRFQTSGEEADSLQYYLLSVKVEVLNTDEETETPGEPEVPEEEFEPVVIYENNFENNDLDGWFGRGPAEVEITDDESGDNNAVLVTGRTVSWHGPGINLTELLESGAQYEMEVSVKRVSAEGESTFDAKVAEQPEFYNPVSTSTITDTEWTILKGTYILEGNVTNAEFYVESNNPTEDFYVDNVKITQLTPGEDPGDREEIPEDERVAIFTDFEDGTTQGWERRNGHEELSIANIGANDSSHSLLVENRQSSSDAAKIDALNKLYAGYDYKISVWVKLAEGEPSTGLHVSAAQDESTYPTVADRQMVTSDEWVLLEGEYYVPNNVDEVYFYVEEEYNPDSTSGVSYYIDDFKAEVIFKDNDVQKDLTPLKEIYEDYFYIGNAAENFHFNGRTGELLRHHHNLVTAENVMKPDSFYNEIINDDDFVVDLEYTNSNQTQFLNNAKENGLLVHGHVLIWHSQSPGLLWGTDTGRKDVEGNRIYEPIASREQALANMQEHIEKVMTDAHRVAGNSIISWDVVNEALETRDWSNPEDWQSKLRSTPDVGWLHSVGDDYIYEAFKHARKVADELGRHDMVLYYNDYNDHDQGKARTMYHMIKDINEQYAEDFPEDSRKLISGVGMQAHYTTTVNVENVRESLERFIDLEIEIGVTELDVGASESTTLTERENLEQAYFYAQLFDLYKEHSDHISRVTFWGLSDGHSWRSATNPLLFDRNLQAKTAYFAVADPEKYLAENEDPGVVIARQGNAAFGTPVIDGEIDDIWNEAPALPINRFQTAHNGATGEARVLWDNENLYVLVEVNDNGLDKSASDAHEQDSVEVFIDEQNTKAASYGDGHAQYRVNFDNEQSFNGDVSEDFESRTVVNGTNYLVEMRIPFKTTTLDSGQVIGFDVQINDAVNGSRNSVAIWSDYNSGMGWSDPSVFGELTLIAGNEIIIEEDEEIVIEPEQKVIVKSGDKEVSIKTPVDLPTGTKVKVNFVDPETIEDPKSESGEDLNVAGEIVEVDLTYPEGYEDFKGEFELVLSYNRDYDWVSVFYLNEDGVWERRTGGVIDRENEVVRITVQGFSTYGVFEVTADEVIEDLEEVIRDLTDRIDNLEGNADELQNTIDELRAKLEEISTSNQTLQDLINQLLARLQELEDRVNELEGGDTTTPDQDDEDSDPSDDDSGPVLEDPDADTDEDSDEDADKDTDSDSSDKDGDALPSTATSLFNYMLIGMMILIAGAGLALYSYKRKNA